MSLYYTPNLHRPHSPRGDTDGDSLGDDRAINFEPRQLSLPVLDDGPRQRRREAPLDDGPDTGSIFIFPRPSSSTSPTPSTSYPSPRSPYSEDSVIPQPAHRRRDTETSHLSHVSESESFGNIGDVSTPTTTVTLNIESSPGSAFTDVDEDEGSVEEGLIEAVLWDWDTSDGLIDGPGGGLRRNQWNVHPDEMFQENFARRPYARPWPLQHGSGERLQALIEREQPRNRWRDASRFQHFRHPRSLTYSPLSTPSSDREIDLPSLSPHPTIRVPLLDFFASILGVEDSTVALLTCRPMAETRGSIIFPGHTIQPLPTPQTTNVDEDDTLSSTVAPTDQRPYRIPAAHGFHKALLSPGMELDSRASLKKGLTVFYNTATSVSVPDSGRLLGLMELWSLVSHACARGGNVIKRVYFSTRPPSDVEK